MLFRSEIHELQLKMDSWLQSCNDFALYPTNLKCSNTLKHNRQVYLTKLKADKDRLFESEKEASLDFLDLGYSDTEFHRTCVVNSDRLKEHLRKALLPGNSDPKCRFAFVHAEHSRARLKVSYEMFCLLLTYHQVMPTFLDFIFPFGEQEHQKDFHFSGFREEDPWDCRQIPAPIDQLRRSGKEMRLCYNLRSVERAGSHKHLPWSIRQTAIYHSFDIETGNSFWVTVKGNNCMRDRILNSLSPTNRPKHESNEDSFAASLESHLLMCDWAGENWQWYINDLETELQKLTRAALFAPIGRLPEPLPQESFSPYPPPMSPSAYNGFFPGPSRSGTNRTFSPPGSPRSKFTTFSRAQTAKSSMAASHSRTPTDESNAMDVFATNVSDEALSSSDKSLFAQLKGLKLAFTKPQNAKSSEEQSSDEKKEQPENSPTAMQEPPELPPELEGDKDPDADDKFEFADLQRIQTLEETTQEALLVLRLNISVLEELKGHYHYITNHASFPKKMKDACESDINKFEKCISRVEKDLRMQQARAEILLRLVAERKTLLYGILQYRSLRASQIFAQKAQISAQNMEEMTNSMHDIAHKTRQETVSMKIITLVTLIFLPGTAIASVMSTDIIHFNKDGSFDFQSRGLWAFLAACLPLMALTFLGWYIVSWLVKRDKGSRSNSESLQLENYSDKV